MTQLSALTARFALAALVGLGTIAQAQPARGLDARLDRLTQDLSLTADQAAGIDAVAARHADADRADLWAAAADVRDVLTDAQIDQLQQAVEARRGERGDRVRDGQRRPRGQQRAGAGRPGRGAGGDRPHLTEQERDAVRAVRDDVRQQAEALAEQFRSGAISDDEFVVRTRALREDGARRVSEVLPAEMAQRLAQTRDRREAEQAARDRALALTDAQKERLLALRLDRVREAQGPDMRPTLDADGRLDRGAFRESMRDARGERRDAVADVLTEDQRDLVFLHRVLAMGARDGARRPGRRGGRR